MRGVGDEDGCGCVGGYPHLSPCLFSYYPLLFTYPISLLLSTPLFPPPSLLLSTSLSLSFPSHKTLLLLGYDGTMLDVNENKIPSSLSKKKIGLCLYSVYVLSVVIYKYSLFHVSSLLFSYLKYSIFFYKLQSLNFSLQIITTFQLITSMLLQPCSLIQ